MNKRRVLLWVVTVCLLAALIPSTVFAASDGWVKEGTNWYYYEYGSKICDTYCYYIEGEYYGFDANGVMYAGGWIQSEEGDYYYYGSNGVMCRDGAYQIGGKYYAFDWNGRMYKDTDVNFSAYDETLGYWTESYYRAKSDGSLYVNEWYQAESGFYYYGSDAKQYRNGVYSIKGKYYAFEWNGIMYADTTFNMYDEEAEKSFYYRATADGSLYTGGWLEIDGEYYYYNDKGQQYREGIYQINGKYYGFDWNGRMYDDTTFWVYEYDEEGNFIGDYLARAAKGGVVYVNTWYQEGETWCYYGAKGKAPNDFYKVGTTWYYFENGYMVKNRVVWSELYQANYYISTDGKSSVKAPANGWWKPGERYYYFANGKMYTGGLYQISGKYYGFDWDGEMYDNTTFWVNEYDADGNWINDYQARAAEGGVVYVNAWYQNGDTWYYYGAKGKAPNDFYKVGATWYYFENGRMATNKLVYSQSYGKYYVISADGKSSKEVQANGWVAVGEDYYYVKDGEFYKNAVYQIGGNYYGFDYDGRMYKNTSFSKGYYDEEGNWRYAYYRAGANGALYVNKWYQSGSEWYYYGAAGKGGNDFVKVGNTWYFFEYGCMVTNRLVYSNNYGKYYVISKDGKSSTVINKDGWIAVGDSYYYIKNGELYQNCIQKIGNTYYGFDYEGRMYDDTMFSMSYYDEDQDMWKYPYYRAKEGGALYVNEWYEEGSDWYYYGAEGKGAQGFTQLGGKWYYFSEARMLKSQVVYDKGKAYALNEDGAQVKAQGKQDIGDCYVYVNADGTVVEEDWVKISNKWHYFEPYMVANTVRNIDGVLYAVGNTGACVAVTGNGIYDIGISGKVYLENGKIAEGWKKVGSAWYYFAPGMVKNDVYEIEETYYVFDQNGKMFTGGWILLGYGDEWYYGYTDYSYAYADASGKAAIGLKTINGKQYYFNDYGYMLSNTTVEVDGVEYVLNESGVATKAGDGWTKVDGKYYYVKNGEQVTYELLKIDSKLYAFDGDGAMITNDIAWINGGYVLAGSNGVVLTGWQKFGNNWYYGNTEGYLYEGKQTIGGKTYVFDYEGELRIGTFQWGGMIYTTDTSGAVVSEKDPANGWSYVGGSLMYYQNGQAYNGWVGDYLIDGGYAVINTYTNWQGNYYAFDTYGRYIKSGWHQFEYGFEDYSRYVYAKAGGKLCCNEWLKIGSTYYYFDGVYMLSGGTYEVDGELCKFDKNGKYLGTDTELSGDGWTKSGGVYYYFHAGEPIVGVHWINGERYIFDYDGMMLCGGFVYFEGMWYYTNDDGTIPNYTGWKWLNGEWCYFNSSNLPVTGWFQDNGKTYYGMLKETKTDVYIAVATGVMYLNGDLHKFAADGVHQGTTGIENGWYKYSGDYYYFRNGKAVSGYQVIDGKSYYFASGVMQTDILTYRGYFGSNGELRTTKGWYEIADDIWIYVLDNGELCNGIHKINGVEYYFIDYIQYR